MRPERSVKPPLVRGTKVALHGWPVQCVIMQQYCSTHSHVQIYTRQLKRATSARNDRPDLVLSLAPGEPRLHTTADSTLGSYKLPLAPLPRNDCT